MLEVVVGSSVVGGIVVVEVGLGGGLLDVKSVLASVVLGLLSSSEDVDVTCCVLIVTFSVVNTTVFVVFTPPVEGWLADVVII